MGVGTRRKHQIPLELELHGTVSRPVWMLGTKANQRTSVQFSAPTTLGGSQPLGCAHLSSKTNNQYLGEFRQAHLQKITPADLLGCLYPSEKRGEGDQTLTWASSLSLPPAVCNSALLWPWRRQGSGDPSSIYVASGRSSSLLVYPWWGVPTLR